MSGLRYLSLGRDECFLWVNVTFLGTPNYQFNHFDVPSVKAPIHLWLTKHKVDERS